ncbi:MAG: DUF1064 domain-containing protein [Rhodocyclaceae bacterium]|nr:DUF1064 domain-containing protein [Rhodocyclaceae bacterium]
MARINSARVVQEVPRSNRAKYGNKKTQIDGRTFDSKREAHRYVELRRMAEAGLIEDLRCQVPFVLAPAVMVKGRKRPPLRFFADFVYSQDGKQIVEDAKGYVTEGYRIKRHLMASVLGIQVVEV